MSRKRGEKKIVNWKQFGTENFTKQYQSDIQKWIKGIEEENQASKDEITFDDNKHFNLISDDTAIYEAQQLLDNWMEKQTIDELRLELDDDDEKWLSNPQSYQKYNMSSQPQSHLSNKHSNSTPEAKNPVNLSLDVDDIIKGLLDKPVINDEALRRIISDEPIQSDPLISMNARLTQTRERARANREKTNKERQQIEFKKTVADEAKKRISNEENLRRKQMDDEDKKIKLEMIKIRKAMHEEKEKARIENESKMKHSTEAEEIAKKEIQKDDRIKLNKVNRRIYAEDKMRQHVLFEIEDTKMKEKAQNYKLKQKCFFSWHNYCTKKTYQHREIQSLLQWKSKIRYWNRWKRYVQLIKIERETEISCRRMKYMSRQAEAAASHYHIAITRKMFIAWRRWLQSNRDDTQLKQEHDINKLKMETFLNALAQLKSIDNKSNSDSKNVNDSIGMQIRKHNIHNLKKDKADLIANRNQQSDQICKYASIHSSNGENSSSIDTKDINSNTTITDRPINRSKKKMYASDLHAKLKLDLNNKAKNKFRNKTINPSNENEIQSINTDKEMKIENIDTCAEDCNNKNPISQDRVQRRYSQSRTKSDSQSSFLIAHPNKSENAYTPIISEMERRAQQRAIRKAEVEEIKRKKDEEKLKELQAKEEKRIAEENHLRFEKIRLHREKKEFEKKQEVEKKKRQEAFRIKCERADIHRQNTILNLYGLKPWIKLFKMSTLNMEKAVVLCSKQNQRHIFNAWKKQTVTVIKHREELADVFSRCSLLRKTFKALHTNVHIEDHNKKIALKHNNTKIRKHFLAIWQCYVTNERLAYWTKESEAEEFYERQLRIQSLNHWKNFVLISKYEREQEKRRDKLRSKVRGWLPDFEQIKK